MRLLQTTSDLLKEQMLEFHRDSFNVPAERLKSVFAPYRICPLGAHVDHQLGMVSALATEMGIWVHYSERSDGQCVIRSEGFPGEVQFELSSPPQRQFDWADYARGALQTLQRRYSLTRGLSISINGAVSEVGLSSSAAIGLAYLVAFSEINDIDLNSQDLIELDREIENGFLGLKNGLLDQSAIVLSESGCLTVLDCRSGQADIHPIAGDFVFLAVFSGVRQPLVASQQFNKRVDECLLAGAEIRSLVDGSQSPAVPVGASEYSEFLQVQSQLSSVSRRRARHFYSECERVRKGRAAWQKGDIVGFGQLMNASCESSIHQYQTGSAEMIALYEVLVQAPGVYGARFSGAGFRGCAVALIDHQRRDQVVDFVSRHYGRLFPQYRADLWAFETRPARGLTLL